MSRRLRRVAVVVVTLALVCAAAASAYYTARGTGGANASVGTLSTPSITSATPGANTVALSWSAVTAPAAGPVAYYVRRDGGAASAACPSLAAPTGVTSCTDTGVAVGSHSYTVTAKWRTWTGTSSSTNVSVSYGPVASLVVSTQPGGTITGGTAFPAQPVITAKDAGNNTVANYAGTVTLSIKAGSPAGTLSGCSGSLSNGVTTFSGCKIDKNGSNFRLTASDGTRSVDTNQFNVAVGPLAQLAFTQQPAGAVAATAFTTQPKVTAQDAGGNTIVSGSSAVTLSITSGTGTAGAVLSGCSGSLSNGVTTFSGCKIDKVGSGYQLHASDGTRTTDSTAFAVVAGPMASLAFTTQPSSSTGGVAFPTQPVVTAFDAQGNVATGYNGTIALSIRSGSPSGTLSGCTQSSSNGVVTFAGCKIDLAGTGFRLRAKDGTPQVDSNSFNITTGPLAQFTMTAASGTPTAAANDRLTITATDAGGNVVTSYTGVHNLTFGGASAAVTGTLPTVLNSSGTAVAFGTATAINFASGVSTTASNNATMVLHKAETATITATDGTISDDGSLSVTVAPGIEAKLAWTSALVSAGTLSSPCFFTCSVTGLGDAGTFKAKVSLTDVDGNVASNVAGGNKTVALSRTGAGSFTPGGATTTVTIPGSGTATSGQFTYTAPTSPPSWSSNTLTATLSGFTSISATLNR